MDWVHHIDWNIAALIPRAIKDIVRSRYATRSQPASTQFAYELVRRGILVVPGGKIYTSIAHDSASQKAFVSAAADAMRAVRDARLLE